VGSGGDDGPFDSPQRVHGTRQSAPIGPRIAVLLSGQGLGGVQGIARGDDAHVPRTVKCGDQRVDVAPNLFSGAGDGIG
jgi:hypothetical protein